MTARTFAPWVEPAARQLAEGRREIVRVARRLLPEHWSLPSPLEGWTYRDLLAHLASGDWVCQHILGTILANERLDLAQITSPDWVNAGNAERLAERKDRSIEELIAEVATDGETTQELLAQLTEEHEGRTQEGAPMTLAQYLGDAFPGHDRDHLAQLRTALEQVML